MGSIKGRRGPKPKVNATAVRGRADNYRIRLEGVWDRLWPLLSQAETEQDVIAAFHEAYPDDWEFMPHTAPLILQVRNERSFPKRRKPRINFMADSLAGRGEVSVRRLATSVRKIGLERSVLIPSFGSRFISSVPVDTRDTQGITLPECGAKLLFLGLV